MVAADEVDAETAVLGPQPRRVFRFQVEPLSDELPRRGRDPKVIAEDSLDRARRVRALRDEAGVQEERVVGDALAPAEPARAEADQREEAVDEGIVTAALVHHGEAVLLPGAVEKRQEAVVEEVEELPERVILVADPLDQELGVRDGKNAERPGRSSDRDDDLGGTVGIVGIARRS